MKIAILFSGGKDSTLTVLKALENNYETILVTFIPKNQYSYLFHTSCLEFPRIQAKLLNLEIEEIEISGEKEKEINEVLNALTYLKKEKNIEAIGVGVIKSEYQKKKIEEIAKKLNLKTFFPLWNRDCESHWKELFDKKFKIIISKISTYGLSTNLLGKVIDEKIFEEIKKESLKYGFDLCFEGGEAETLVLDCQAFSHEIIIEDFEIERDVNSYILKIKKFRLKRK
jgi:ABC transporter with metal-binding/Fe-S-binding domain ATP-binding protein